MSMKLLKEEYVTNLLNYIKLNKDSSFIEKTSNKKQEDKIIRDNKN